jgi:prefoldin alpha subunit
MTANIDPAKQQQLAAIEQRVNEMVQQGKALEAYMNDVMSRQLTVSRLVDEARMASTTIQNISSESDVETLMPVGIGVYVKTSVPPIKKLLVNLGAGVAVEKSREDALNYVEARIKEYEVAGRQLEAQRQEIEMRMQQIQAHINQMLRTAQQS